MGYGAASCAETRICRTVWASFRAGLGVDLSPVRFGLISWKQGINREFDVFGAVLGGFRSDILRNIKDLRGNSLSGMNREFGRWEQGRLEPEQGCKTLITGKCLRLSGDAEAAVLFGPIEGNAGFDDPFQAQIGGLGSGEDRGLDLWG